MNFSVKGGARVETLGFVTVAMAGTLITSAATSVANSPLTWVTLGTPSFDYSGGFVVTGQAQTMGTGPNAFYIDIGLGSGECTLAEAINFRFFRNGEGFHVYVPVRVPAGVPVVARCTPTTTSVVFRTAITGYEGGFLTPRVVSKLEAICGASVTLDPGTVGTSPGSWLSITNGGVANDYVGFIVAATHISVLGQDNRWTVDIGVGDAASPGLVVQDLVLYGDGADDFVSNPFLGPIPLNVDRGQPICMRARCNVSSNDRQLFVRLYGLRR